MHPIIEQLRRVIARIEPLRHRRQFALDLALVAEHIDPGYYSEQPVVAAADLHSREDAARHYLEHAQADPVHWFSSSHYLAVNQDVHAAGINPFVHYLRYGKFEGRLPLPNFSWVTANVDYQMLDPVVANASKHLSLDEFRSRFEQTLESFESYRPLVSVIVPNYNHARFLPERLHSVLEQTYRDIEVILLDDASTDESAEILEDYADRFPDKVRVVLNDSNSGSVFRQWRKGYELAKGELVWICESDDTAELDFLKLLVPKFADRSVNLAFCRVQFADERGKEMAGLDAYRERAKPSFWAASRTLPAATWFREPFSIHNVIPNVGGCLMRKQSLTDDEWNQAAEYSVLGDWFLYLTMARGGKIAFEPQAVTYFRQHGSNTSVQSFQGGDYYAEHQRLALAIRRQWDVPDWTTFRFYDQVSKQFAQVAPDGDLHDFLSLDELVRTKPSTLHVLVGFFGFHVGGGEYFPIHLANALVEEGVRVSMLALDLTTVQEEMCELLDSRIAVYSGDQVSALGPAGFLEAAGIDVVHSHHVGVEGLFFLQNQPSERLPFVASLHGTYEVSEMTEHSLSTVTRGVQHWVYTAEKNLKHLKNRPWVDAPVTKLTNAMPVIADASAVSRASLGIGPSTFVFCLVSRPIPEKGWSEAISAITELLKERPDLDLAMILVGEGDTQESLQEQWGGHPALHFVGFQPNVDGILRESDCSLLPTRFDGESHPLILIQALQAGLPIIATDAGDIAPMLQHGKCGVVMKWERDDRKFIDGIKQAMLQMLDSDAYSQMQQNVAVRSEDFSITKLARSYIEIYEETIGRVRRVLREEQQARDSRAVRR